ncbi:AraC family transcriptional regulator (plasmid) [Arthrobacter sp. D3-18]
MIEVSTGDPQEAVSAVSRVFCPHELQLDPRSKSFTTRLRANAGGGLAYVTLEYGAKVEVEPGTLVGLTSVTHAVRGTGTVRQGSHAEEWRGGQTIIISGDRSTQFAFDSRFSQSTIRMDTAGLRQHCEKLLGTGLDDDVRFALQRFSGELEGLWSQIMALSAQRAVLPPSGVGYLQKLAMDLILYRHPHNYSHLFEVEGRRRPRLAGEAVALLDALPDYELLTVSEVAGRIGVSARSLERAFHEAFGMGPSQYLRSRRLDRVRRELEGAPRGASVTDVAVAHGFYHPGRFAKYYREQFGETPSTTVARVGGVSHSRLDGSISG